MFDCVSDSDRTGADVQDYYKDEVLRIRLLLNILKESHEKQREIRSRKQINKDQKCTISNIAPVFDCVSDRIGTNIQDYYKDEVLRIRLLLNILKKSHETLKK